MKFNLKMIAVAAAIVATGNANAALTGYGTGNGSFSLYAFNTVTRDYYIRDLGVLMNDFLPTGTTLAAGDGTVGTTRTPEAGTTFASSDAGFGTWLGAQNQADIRWAAVAGDSISGTGFQRIITTATTLGTVTNGVLGNATGTPNLGGLAGLFTGAGTSVTGTNFAAAYNTNGTLGAGTLALLNTAVDLYYFTRTTISGTAGNLTPVRYGNSANFASVSFNSAGDFLYSLAPAEAAAVPIPAAAWLLGAGLMGLGGAIRRRKAAAEA